MTTAPWRGCPTLSRTAARHDLKLITVADLIKHRRRTEKLVRREAVATLPTVYGEFVAIGYESLLDGGHHLALVKGDVAGKQDVLVRVHSECLTGDVFGSLRCDCGEQLAEAMRRIDAEGLGVVLYMRQEGRGIGLLNKLRGLRAAGARTRYRGGQPGARLPGGSARLRHRRPDPRRPRPLDHPHDDEQPEEGRSALEGYGLTVTERVPIEVPPQSANLAYLRTKREKIGHCSSTRHWPPTKASRAERHCKKTDTRSRDEMTTFEGKLGGKGLRFGIVVGRFNELISQHLLDGALDNCRRHDVSEADVDVAWVPGAFEIPLVAQRWRPAAATTRWYAWGPSSAGARRTSSTWPPRSPKASPR